MDPTKNNATTVEQTDRLSTGVLVGYLIFYGLVVGWAIIGNTFVIIAVCKYRYMQKKMNIFIANLALSDLLFALLSAFDCVAYLQDGWYSGNISCKIQSCLIEVGYTASILTLAVMSLERYLAICRSQPSTGGKRTVAMLLISIWVFSFMFCSVLFYAYRVRDFSKAIKRPLCVNDAWPNSSRLAFYVTHSVVVYLLPLILMAWAHLRILRTINAHRVPSVTGHLPGQKARTGSMKKRRAVRLLKTITVVFFVLWTPFIFVRLIKYFDVSVNTWLWKASQLLILSSTSVNSLIYAYLCRSFRNCFRDLLRSCLFNRRNPQILPGSRRSKLSDTRMQLAAKLSAPTKRESGSGGNGDDQRR